MATKTWLTKKTGTKPEAQSAKLVAKSFMNADDLCDYINENKITPFSINVTERFYMVFYYEKQ
jgi:hypothetical protein